MKLYTKYLFFILLFSFNQIFAKKECFPEKENKLFYNISKLVSKEEEKEIENILRRYYEKGLQMVIIITDTLCGMDIGMYANTLGQEWGVGQKGKDNGVVIVIVPKKERKRGEIFIAPGRGIQDLLPDIVIKRIIDDIILPDFREGDYFRGITKGIEKISEIWDKKSYSFILEEKKGSIFNFIKIIFKTLILILVISFFLIIALITILFGEAPETIESNKSIKRKETEDETKISFGGGKFNGGGAGGSW